MSWRQSHPVRDFYSIQTATCEKSMNQTNLKYSSPFSRHFSPKQYIPSLSVNVCCYNLQTYHGTVNKHCFLGIMSSMYQKSKPTEFCLHVLNCYSILKCFNSCNVSYLNGWAHRHRQDSRIQEEERLGCYSGYYSAHSHTEPDPPIERESDYI